MRSSCCYGNTDGFPVTIYRVEGLSRKIIGATRGLIPNLGVSAARRAAHCRCPPDCYLLGLTV